MEGSGRRVSFNNLVTVARVPCKEDEWESGPRLVSLAESMRAVVREMNSIDGKIKNDTDGWYGWGGGEDDVIKRMVLSSYTEALSRKIYDHPSVNHVYVNTDMKGVRYDDAGLIDKVVLDFLNSLVRGVSIKSKDTGDICDETLYILLNPSPDDFVGDMDHCLVIYTEARRQKGRIPSVQMALDLRMDR